MNILVTNSWPLPYINDKWKQLLEAQRDLINSRLVQLEHKISDETVRNIKAENFGQTIEFELNHKFAEFVGTLIPTTCIYNQVDSSRMFKKQHI
jgi:hypothetical protein